MFEIKKELEQARTEAMKSLGLSGDSGSNRIRMTREDAIKIYDIVIKKLDARMTQAAYKKVSKVGHGDDDDFLDPNDFLDIYVNVDFSEGNMYYLSINKWGFSQDDLDVKTKELCLVSYSTIACLDYSFKDRMTYNKANYGKENYKRMHYHNIILRMRAFRNLGEFKTLKLEYRRIAKQAFNNEISPDVVLIAINYGIPYDKPDNVTYSACHFKTKIIVFNGKYNTLQGATLDAYDRITLVHEMCHEYADEHFGGNWETDLKESGAALYGLSREKYGRQVDCHGRKFGKAVQIAADNLGIEFNAIFDYGLRYEKPLENLSADGLNYSKLDRVYGKNYWDRVQGIKQWPTLAQELRLASQKVSDYINKYHDDIFDMCGCELEVDKSRVGRQKYSALYPDPEKIRRDTVYDSSFQIKAVGQGGSFEETFLFMIYANNRYSVDARILRTFQVGSMGYELASERLKGKPGTPQHEASMDAAIPKMITTMVEQISLF